MGTVGFRIFFCALAAVTLATGTPIGAARAQDLASRGAADLYDRISPSVVQIHVAGFTANPGDRRHESRAPQFCSAFIIDAAAGLVVTATCDASHGDGVEVTFARGPAREATFVGKDEATGIALYRIPTEGVAALEWADTRSRTGEPIITIGYGYGLGPLVSTGLIAGQDLQVDAYPLSVMFVDVITPRGMAGAPVVNLSGEVVGMICAVYGSATGTNRAYGAVVPTADIRRVVASILAANAAR